MSTGRDRPTVRRDALSLEPIVEIRTTCGDRAAAEACAESLIAERLAACVQVDGPIRSTYRWQDRIETADEWRCICKTTASRAAACRERIVRTHAYETPEILQVTVEATAAYAAWVRDSVAADLGLPRRQPDTI